MQKVLSNQLWRKIKAEAAKAKVRQAAIAYVTRDLVGFEKGDGLVTDASKRAVRMGETSAKLLSTLFRKGVELYSCAGLHAKVLLLDGTAVIGSGNLSASSESTLVEAAIMTNASTVASGVASFIEQLKGQSVRLDETSLRALAKIKVVKHGFGPGSQAGKRRRAVVSELGTRTWLIGVIEDDRDYTESEQRLIDQERRELAQKFKVDKDSFTTIRWSGASSFPRRAQAGDQVIQIWRQTSNGKRPSSVLKPIPILDIKRLKGSTFAFVTDSEKKSAQMKWSTFKKLMKRLGERRAFGPHSERVLDPELADAIVRNWKSAMRYAKV